MQRIEREPAASVYQRRGIVAGRRLPGDQSLEDTGELLAQLLALEELPFVEGRAFGQVESSHEIAAIELHRGGQCRGAGRTQCSIAMAMIFPYADLLLEHCNVQP